MPPNPNPNPERRRRLACLVAACLTTLLTTACDATNGDAQDPKPRWSPTPSPTSGPTKDLRTCEDGDCTVEVREGDVIPFGENVRAPDLTIDAIGPTGVDLRLSGEGTTSAFSGQSPDRGGGVSTYNGTDFRILEIRDDRAVLRIKPNGGL
ncbi:hypothetical protein ACFVTT_04385 [Streptomyces niveus]|uniref:hypothetical protein n=1 Tax=Streptomyces niveus TaxID=193462 RepID=UPI00341E4424